jgi:hypothetical protein
MQGPTLIISKKFEREFPGAYPATSNTIAPMAPPVTKRRKLDHSDSEGESEGSFAGFDEKSDAASETSTGAAEDGADKILATLKMEATRKTGPRTTVLRRRRRANRHPL